MTNKSALRRFFTKFEVGEGCWVWDAARDVSGYGLFRDNYVLYKAHRFMYELLHGEIADPKLYACHTCDNPACVRPDHLFLGTAADNARDRDSKGRWRDHWKNKPMNGQKKLCD